MLSQLSFGKRIFIDSNIFIYHFLGINPSCSALLSRVETKDILGFTSVIVIAEVWHRLMIAEAIEIFKLTPRQAVNYLKSRHQHVGQLTKCHQALRAIPKMNITIWSLPRKIFHTAESVSREFGLLTNDSLNLALIRQHKLTDIATNDSDFEQIQDIKVWKPA